MGDILEYCGFRFFSDFRLPNSEFRIQISAFCHLTSVFCPLDLVGGLGLGPSAEIGDDNALFQPSHGSAPQIAGLNVAHPLATILSAAMMLDWLGERNADADAITAARRIESAVAEILSTGNVLTPDLGGKHTTAQLGDAMLKVIESGNDTRLP